jgi:hypothetical protein
MAPFCRVFSLVAGSDLSRKTNQRFYSGCGTISGFFSPPLIAQEAKGWQFGSLPANSSVSKPDDQQVYEVLLKMLDRWNAHDIEGCMEVYWRSPDLFVIVDSEQFNV